MDDAPLFPAAAHSTFDGAETGRGEAVGGQVTAAPRQPEDRIGTH
ncbi:hypothetical protein GCM10009416_34820 [Craurococcus roseus]|uniref:Uncharacterized protein n=1 Tax=Craurococcus roseus TaxID=77585 RepID=A0ABP3QM25_9PROT